MTKPEASVRCLDMDVSKNSGFSPQIIHGLIGFSIIFTIHFGGKNPIFGNNHHIVHCNTSSAPSLKVQGLGHRRVEFAKLSICLPFPSHEKSFVKMRLPDQPTKKKGICSIFAIKIQTKGVSDFFFPHHLLPGVFFSCFFFQQPKKTSLKNFTTSPFAPHGKIAKLPSPRDIKALANRISGFLFRFDDFTFALRKLSTKFFQEKQHPLSLWA